MATLAFVVLENKEELIAELREQFKAKYIDQASPKLAKFDGRDVNRIFNDDLYALSFLNWKKGVMKDSLDMVAQVLEWRKENNMGDISVDVVGTEFIKRGICYIHGRGIDGKRIMCSVGRLQTKNDKEKVRKLLMLWLERLQRTEPGQHITFILDTYKTAMSNVDLGMIRFIIDSFSTYFPDLLERIIILDMPWIMNAIWKVVKQWMSEEQRSRVVFCSRQELGKFVEKDQLPEAMNGTSDWTFSFPPFPDDLSQKFDFKDDPMNFSENRGTLDNENDLIKDFGEPEASGNEAIAPSPTPNSEQKNGSVPQSGSSPKEDIEINDDEPGTSSSFSVSTTPTESIAADSRRPSETRRHSTKEVKRNSSSSRSPDRKGQGELRRRHTSDSLQKQSTIPPNVSFKSLAPIQHNGDFEAVPTSAGDSRNATDTYLDEIALGKLLVMSPVSALTFKLVNDRYETFINIRNPNQPDDDATRCVNVAFKIKTTSPEKYHVKPSLGFIAPGESLDIRIYIEKGHESRMSLDRFLLLYKNISFEEGERPSHSDMVKFWRKQTDKKSHSEHRVRVRLEGTAGSEVQRQRSETKIPNGTLPKEAVPSQSSSIGLFGESTSPDGVPSQLQQQIAMLDNKVIRLESDSRWIRRRLRHTMGLLFIVIVLLLILLKELLVLSGRVSQSVSL